MKTRVSLKNVVNDCSLKKRLLPAPTDLSKLNDVVKSEFVTKTVYEKLVKKANVIN